ncbi:MAG TPA: protein kinase [Rudaea sp.]|jgi:serine/threonine-protein kinase|nr:protein kinase [Rudaea sp.]
MAATDQPSRGVTVPLALKFFIGSAFLIALAVGTAVVVTYIQGNRIAARAVDTALSTSTAVQKEIEQSRLDQLQLKLQQIAADPSTVKYVSQASGTTNNLPGLSESSDTDTKSIPDLLKERETQFHFDLGIALDGKGIVLGRSDQTEAFQESLANDPLVKPAIEKLQPFSGYWRQGDKLYQAAIVPLGQDQDLVGFLLLAQRVNDELSGQMAKISGAQIAFWLPQDNQLRLVASSLPEADAKALQDAVNTQAPEMAAAVASGQPIPRLSLQFAGQKWASQLAPTAAAGEGSLGAVLALASTDKIIASYRDILNWVLIGGAISIVIALFLSYLLAKGILRPVRTMAEVAEQAAAGNYRAQIGLSGNDELARLSRAFDSLLSDLREKSDIEGYVSNLSRFLPDPAREGASPAAKASSSPTPTPPRRDTLSLLGLEFRDLANVSTTTSAEEAASLLANASALIESAAPNAAVKQATGARFVIGFGGESRAVTSLRALAIVRERAAQAGLAQPASAIVSGAVVHLTNPERGAAVLGVASLHLDRLLPEAVPGQTLLTRQGGDEIKAALGDVALSVAVGATTGKKFYALSDSALKNLPAASIPTPTNDGDAATVITSQKPSKPGGRTTRQTALDPGSTFGGRYRILSELGAGGMGVVYKAHDLELDDVVALKMLRPSALVDQEQLDRLKSEIKLARMITHPNVLRTFDFGEVEGLPYISMEYVRGLTLRYLLNETRRIPYSAGLRIARQLCAGLAAAHEVGVLHRDIKPENLILQQTGNAKLMDFGIARPIRTSVKGHTEPGTFLGTPNYSPPEQLAGEELDQRADIYSSGVLMCEMFCGKLPFAGTNTLEIYIAQTQQAPIKPSEFWPEIPPELEAIILRCLSRQPADRYPTANELAGALGQLRA